MSEHSQPRSAQVRIVYRPDGTAEVNGVTVWPAPGGDVRDAAYAAAVALVANAPGPVLAASVEADGAVYPLTLYPSRAGSPADEQRAGSGRARRGGRGLRALGLGSGAGLGLFRGRPGGSGGPARFSRLPTLRLGWLLTAVIGCVLVGIMAALLIDREDPSLVRLSVDQQNQDVGSAQPQASGAQPGTARAERGFGRFASGAAGAALGAVGVHGPSGDTSTGPSGATSGTGTTAPGVGPSGTPTAPGSSAPGAASGSPSQTSDGQPTPSGPSRSKSAPTGSPTVSELGLVLVGGNKTNQDLDFLLTVSASGTGPVTLTYSYAGDKGGAPVTRRLVLSGETEYAVPGQIPAKPYCGQTVTMRAATSPAAANGPAVSSATPGC